MVVFLCNLDCSTADSFGVQSFLAVVHFQHLLNLLTSIAGTSYGTHIMATSGSPVLRYMNGVLGPALSYAQLNLVGFKVKINFKGMFIFLKWFETKVVEASINNITLVIYKMIFKLENGLSVIRNSNSQSVVSFNVEEQVC